MGKPDHPKGLTGLREASAEAVAARYDLQSILVEALDLHIRGLRPRRFWAEVAALRKHLYLLGDPHGFLTVLIRIATNRLLLSYDQKRRRAQHHCFGA